VVARGGFHGDASPQKKNRDRHGSQAGFGDSEKSHRFCTLAAVAAAAVKQSACQALKAEKPKPFSAHSGAHSGTHRHGCAVVAQFTGS